MKKTILFILAMLVLVAICIFTPVQKPTLAAHDDFDFSYTVNPSLVGYKGADIGIGIRVQNTGPTTITGFEVSVTTMAGYSQRWSGNISPGTTYSTVLFNVPFSEADVGVDKLLYVKIENDGDGDYNDATKVRTFQVSGTSRIFDIGWSITPHFGYYMVGESVTITHTFRNTFADHAATGANSRAYLTLNGTHIYTSPDASLGLVMPGASETTAFEYTFTEDDVGHMRASCDIYFRMMGEDYEQGGWTLEFDVRAPAPVVPPAFTTSLSASPTSIYAGDEVTFTISFENTGDGTIGTFEVRNAEGGLEATTEPVPSGVSGTTRITSRIYESVDVSFVVVGISSAGTVSHETNTVHITVLEPEESPEAAETTTIEPTTTMAPTAALTVAPDVEATQAAEETEQTTASPDGNNNLALYIIIGVLGLLVIAGGITVPLLLRRSKKKGDKGRKDKL